MIETVPALRLSGLPGGSEAWWLLKNRAPGGRILALTATDEAAQTLSEDLLALGRWRDPAAGPAAAYFAQEEPESRPAALSAWTDPGGPHVLAAPWDTAKDPLPSPELFRRSRRRLALGDRIDRSEFLAHLLIHGYNRTDSVEQAGEVAARGEVLDLWSPDWDAPARVLWPGDRIESLRRIDLSTQRSSDHLRDLVALPASLKAPPPPPASPSTLFDFLKPEDVLFESLLPADARPAWTGRRVVRADAGPADREEPYLSPPPLGDPSVPGRDGRFAALVRGWMEQGWRAAVFCRNAGEQERLEEILLEQDRSLARFVEEKRIDFPLGGLNRGFLDPSEKLAVLSNAEIFGRRRGRLRLPKFSGGGALRQAAELAKGDYVVHERFGVGRYAGLDRVRAGGVEADYLRLEYRGGDRVFVPLFEFRQVQKYVGAEGKRPALSSLDTSAWDNAKEQAREAVAALAKELLERAARRASTPGLSFPPDSHMEKEFAAAFLYDPTPDQLRAFEDVRRDMIAPGPMDRLVSGDVGYGKTEVAMRAAMKAVTAGRQVAVLAPTTILAEQHGRNFKDRFADYPVSVAVLSRFSKPADRARVLQDLRRGVIDILIGTHRLLSPDVAFKDLGLVVIDEEHRFGVKQKERIAAFRDAVDVLALSATPIPRTLGQALGGVKALSVIETPPEGRLPIATHVGPYDEKVVAAAVEHELRRGGQVFCVHNRIASLDDRRRRLEKALRDHGFPPDAFSIRAVHGRMSGAELERAMWDFLQKKFNILLATSIIESGLDIPSVNTLIVEDAEDFGLSQLYQLRGRVGRERQKAYCYLFHTPGASLGEEALKRLAAMREFASLGSGFKLALRDMEIRGAGNLLGAQQHGFMSAVGLDLYGRLLNEEIDRLKDGGRTPAPAPDAALELPLSAYLPEDYLPSETERVSFYKRLLDTPAAGLDALRAELEDRCGPAPDPATRLFQVARLRHKAREKKALRLTVVRGGLEIHFREDAAVSPDALKALMARHGPALSFLPGPPFGIRFDPMPAEDLAPWCLELLSSLG